MLALLLAGQTMWMMKRPAPAPARPIASAPLTAQPAVSMSDDELLEAVNNDLSREVPQALAPVGAITSARNKIAASAAAATISAHREGENK